MGATISPEDVERTPLESTTSGRLASETPKTSAISSLHSPRPRSNSSVRDAFDASVRWSRPADRRAMSQESTVPAAAAAAPSMFRSAHASFVAVKYGSRTRPVTSRTRSSWPTSRRRRQSSAVRRSCQTIAGAIGSSVRRFHSTSVSRWLVMPIAATSRALAPAALSASRALCWTAAQISLGSCSTQPGRG